ncbi:hypothetical protein [Pseudomonas donghuensis]|uniref:Uncharacterized protein n=1 Tax=Pseudomonas donghuensis TaxID=1163398 RepID=A0AAQ0DNW9_9PSED|nr:hypothetical protein [Pseudomonas donghuensis]QWE81230.1 hypothetical protein BV82_10185 [Pseudomonas donghuensis]
MSYALRQPSFIRLKAQMSLTGRFNHALYDKVSRRTVHATVDTERSAQHLHIVIRMGSTLNSICLPLDAKSNANRVADNLEAIANGRLDTADTGITRELLIAAA